MLLHSLPESVVNDPGDMTMLSNVIIVATLDTKGDEVEYIKKLVQEQGCATTVMDVGTLLEPAFPPP